MINRDSTGIYRIDNDRNRIYGWKVCVQRRKKSFVKLFTDRVHGGKEKALDAALSYHDTVLSSNPPFLKSEYVNILRRNQYLGMPPGSVNTKAATGSVSGLPRPGRKKTVKAHDLAVRARKRAVAELTGAYEQSPRKRRIRRKLKHSPPVPDLRIKRLYVGHYHIQVEFHDARVIAVPLPWFPKLRQASEKVRKDWKLDQS